MNLIIDANVIAGYYRESVLGDDAGLSAQTENVFDGIGTEHRVFLDDQQQVETEWRNVVDREWFEAWYGDLLASGAGTLLPVGTCNVLRGRLEAFGFPRGSKDFWYIRTAIAVVQVYGNAVILTEDMDFYEPSKKSLSDRPREIILLASAGKVAKHLQKKEGISVICVANCF